VRWTGADIALDPRWRLVSFPSDAAYVAASVTVSSTSSATSRPVLTILTTTGPIAGGGSTVQLSGNAASVSITTPIRTTSVSVPSGGTLTLRGPTPTSTLTFSGANLLLTIGWQKPVHWLLGFGFEFSNRPFTWLNSSQPGPSTSRVVVPLWFLAVVFSILPALRLRAIARTRGRRRRQLCIECGYDLRATPERCPECGYTEN
jgi:hypothetical protein